MQSWREETILSRCNASMMIPIQMCIDNDETGLTARLAHSRLETFYRVWRHAG